jgi:hypothetical protein
LDSAGRTFYTSLGPPAGEPVKFPNLDGDTTDLGMLEGEYLIIQSGGKMWCGYGAFIEHIRQLAPYLSDALFYINDEVGYCGFLDEFRIRGGRLEYRRVVDAGCSMQAAFIASEADSLEY